MIASHHLGIQGCQDLAPCMSQWKKMSTALVLGSWVQPQCLEVFTWLSIGVMRISPCHAIGYRWFEFLTALLFPEPSAEHNTTLGPIRRHLNTAVGLSDCTELQDVKLPPSFEVQLLPCPWIQLHVGAKLRHTPFLSPLPTIHGNKSRLKGWRGSGPLCICWMILR